MQSSIPWYVLVLSLSLFAGCGGTSSDDEPEEPTPLNVTTVSGDTINLAGHAFVTDCRTLGGGSPADVIEGLLFSGNRAIKENVYYGSSDGSCTSRTDVTSFTSSFSVQAESAVSDWVDGAGNTVSAPAAEDGLGSPGTPTVTMMERRVIASSGGKGVLSVGTTLDDFFVVDDTTFDTNGCLVLYRRYDTTRATTANRYTNGNCP